MVTTLKSGTRPIQLGVVTDLKPTLSSRDGSIDIPNARGASRQDLGSQAGSFALAGTLTGDTRFDYFQQFDRIRMLGRSLKLESQFINTVAYINTIGFSRAVGDFLGYTLALKESLFKQISSCDDQVGWSQDSGDLTNEYDSPEPKEGEFYLKNAIYDNDSAGLAFEPSDPFDMAGCEYLAFWFQVTEIAYISEASILLYNGDVTSSAYFQSKLLLPNIWYRILLHKSEFSNYQSFNFSTIYAFYVQLTLTANRTTSMMIDDLGVYE